MAWSRSFLDEIVERFWSGNEVRCPNDNLSLRVKLRRFVLGDYTLAADCPLCGEKVELRRGDDPRRSFFRSWTEEESQGLCVSSKFEVELHCPVCGARLERDWLTRHGIKQTFLRCLRCGNSNLWRYLLQANAAVTVPLQDPQAASAE